MAIFQPFCARRAAALCALVGLMGQAAPAFAQADTANPPRGAAPLSRAREAWGRGDFDVAETLFREALDEGQLPVKDTLEAYVFLGAAHAVLGKKDPALAAFRQAAVLDSHFKVPPEAGKKAVRLADTAKRQGAKVGVLAMHADMPPTTGVGKGFAVMVRMDPTHAATLTRVGLRVGDGLSGRPYVFEQESAEQLKFQVPGSVAVADARLLVKLVGLDAHDNELVATEGHVQVDAGAKAGAPILAVVPATPGHTTAPRDTTHDEKKKGGFFSTAWPYVIGGALIAGGGAAAYFATRPSDQVTVTQVHVQAIR